MNNRLIAISVLIKMREPAVFQGRLVTCWPLLREFAEVDRWATGRQWLRVDFQANVPADMSTPSVRDLVAQAFWDCLGRYEPLRISVVNLNPPPAWSWQGMFRRAYERLTEEELCSRKSG